MLGKVVHANDGSEHAFHALAQALAIAKQNNSELHMVSVEKIGYVAESTEQATEGTGTASGRFRGVLQRARAMADDSQVDLHTHVVAGHPVRSIVDLAAELNADLLVIGARGHSTFYVWLGACRTHHETRVLPCARCEIM